MSHAADNVTDPREILRRIVATLEHVLPAQASIRDFVHHNTLHGFQHLPFPEALAGARRLTGASAWLPEARFRDFFHAGRILEEDLQTSLSAVSMLAADEIIVDQPAFTLRRRDVYRTALLHPLRPVTAATLAWQVTEHEALTHFQADVSREMQQLLRERTRRQGAANVHATIEDLWRACCESIGVSPELSDDSISGPAPPDTGHDEAGALWQTRLIRKEAMRLLDALTARVGDPWTLRDLLMVLTGEDIFEQTREHLIRHVASHLDEGLAAWHNPARKRGFYTAWRASAGDENTWALSDLPEWRQHLERLPEDPLETIAQELQLLGVKPVRWAGYLQRLALELPGWSGMFLWRHQRPDYNGQRDVPVNMIDYLAVRLVLERIHAQGLCRRHWRMEASLPMLRWHFRRHPAELIVRHALFTTSLPEALHWQAQKRVMRALASAREENDRRWIATAQRILTHRAPVTDAASPRRSRHEHAWPLFRLAQHLGLTGSEIRSLDTAAINAIFECFDRLDPDTAGNVWLCAYEGNYRDQIFATLKANHGRVEWPTQIRPRAQLVFCMDDREEGMRRHVEEVAPDIQTLGAAGFFGVAMNWRGLDDLSSAALCPVVVTPAHAISEVPAPGKELSQQLHQRRLDWRRRLRELAHRTSHRGLLGATATTVLGAPLALLVLMGRLLAPRSTGHLVRKLLMTFDPCVSTRVAFKAVDAATPATPEHPRAGFTDAEQAERVRGLLRTMGLTSRFAPLVVLLGHGSSSENNPHLAAYDCGACSGRHGGPNARVFAAMANRPEIRVRLAEQGLSIPYDTWFIGAEHNTGDDSILWYDEDLVPEEARARATELKMILARAGRAHAQERCRRFATASPRLSPERAVRHVAGRVHDLSQARPELGHVTNACAIIGRRDVTRGAFFDRRAFLVSYDPMQDPEGDILENILLAVGPVGAGISLEYYFSTVNNERLGCSTKVMHNITGFLGVQEGTSSDLRTGLPQQMIEIHEAMRLLIVIEADTGVISRLIERQPSLRELIGNGWVQVAAKDPRSSRIDVFSPEHGWQNWQKEIEAPPVVARSADWFTRHREALPPALLEQGRPGEHANVD
ncbi:MAG: DUF2309 domain-containing protein [Gammaproteobacteria bacterium]|nr:DUF2309 domain-containing protein [Gammaproteobacteria bacterium]